MKVNNGKLPTSPFPKIKKKEVAPKFLSKTQVPKFSTSQLGTWKFPTFPKFLKVPKLLYFPSFSKIFPNFAKLGYAMKTIHTQCQLAIARMRKTQERETRTAQYPKRTVESPRAKVTHLFWRIRVPTCFRVSGNAGWERRERGHAMGSGGGAAAFATPFCTRRARACASRGDVGEVRHPDLVHFVNPLQGEMRDDGGAFGGVR